MALNKDNSDGQDCHLDELKDFCQKDCNTNRDVRNLRNLAEKQRRDKLNGYINELANSVPLVTLSSKRLDKTSVLRLSAAYLRLNKTALNLKRCQRNKRSLNNSNNSNNNNNANHLWRPTKFNFNHLKQLLESVEGFIVVTTGLGKIIYVSHSVENFLGHQNIEMIGHSLTSFLHPNDIESVFDQIKTAYGQVSEGSQTSDKISFQCRLREKNQARSEVITYQMVQVSGHISSSAFANDSIDENNPKCSTTDDKEDNIATNILFKGFVQIIPTNPMAELSLMDADLDEYVSRHSLDGTLLFADHRISGIIGYLPTEVYGKSAYNYILPDDHSIALFAHKLMLSNSNGTGTIVHRLRTKTGSFVFLQSSGCLQYDKNGQIDHWVCVSRLLIENEGDKERDKFVKRFTPHIYNISPTALYESLQIVIGPRSSHSSFTTSHSLQESNSSNSVRIQEIKSPSPQPQPNGDTFNNQNTSIITSSPSLQQQQQLQLQPQLQPQPQQNEVQINSNQVTQQYTTISSTYPQSTIVNSMFNQEMNVQSSGLLQIQTLPIFPVNSTQLIAQQTSNSINSCNNLSLNKNNSIIKSNNNNNNNNSISNNIINFYVPTSVSVSCSDQKNTDTNNSCLNVSNISAMNSVSNITSTVGNASNTSKTTNDLTHLLGATVLTFDSQQRPVLSVYSPSMTLEEVSRMNQNQNQNNINVNSSSRLNCPDSSDINISQSMDSSFYSPNIKNCDDMTPEPLNKQLTLNGLNYEELSNHSNNSLMGLSFPSNESQCDFGLMEYQFIGDNILEDALNPSNDTSIQNNSNVFDSNETELDPTIKTETSVFSLVDPETSPTAFFTSKRSQTQL